MPIGENDIDRFEPAKLVTDLRDLDLVQRTLQHELHITSQSPKELQCKALDLALLELPGLDSEIAPLWQDTKLAEEAKQERLHWLQTFKHGISIDQVTLAHEDLAAFALRRHFRRAYQGWAPTCEKVHVVDRIQSLPHWKGPLHTSAIGHPAPLAHLDVPPGTGRPGPRVGIADTAIYPHADLVGRFVGDTIRLPHALTISEGHATAVAGVVLQRAPAAELVVREVLGPNGINTSSWDVAVKLMDFLQADVAVLNLSFGCVTADSLPPLVLRRAVERLSRHMIVVAAAGNHGATMRQKATGVTPQTPSWPAGLDDVVAVGAFNPADGSEPDFSPRVPLVDLLAPGVGVPTTFPDGEVYLQYLYEATGELLTKETLEFGTPGYATWEGTSLAAANVSGEIAARMGSRDLSAHESLAELLHPNGYPASDIIPFRLT